MTNQPPAKDRRMAAVMASIVGRMDTVEGLSETALLQRLAEMTRATKTLVAIQDGAFSDRIEVPDNPVALRAIVEALTLRAAYPAKQLELTGTVRVEQLNELAIRLQALPDDQLADMLDTVDAELVGTPRAALPTETPA